MMLLMFLLNIVALLEALPLAVQRRSANKLSLPDAALLKVLLQ